MEKTKEKSEEQAAIIKSIAIQIYCLDVDYCREIATEMKVQANRQESLSVLNPNYPQSKNDLLRIQAKALSLLCDYVDALKVVGEINLKIQNETTIRDEISRLFV
jgi:hypothetical protein